MTVLMVFGYVLIIKTARKLSSNGLLDDEFKKENNKRENKWISIVLNGLSLVFSLVLVSLCAIGITYRLKGEQFTINNKTAFVVATNSMTNYYNEEYKNELINEVTIERSLSKAEADEYLSKTQFEAGDLLTFTTLDISTPLTMFDVYGYQNSKGEIITHRLVGIKGDKYIFRGDFTVDNDMSVSRSQILYHYNETKVSGVGIFVLFFSSGFGIYTIFVTIIILGMSDLVFIRYRSIKKERLSFLEQHSNAH